MLEITNKQRNNARRELTSISCAGCDGNKSRGSSFCRTCRGVLGSLGHTSLFGPLYYEEKYMEALGLLLSRRGQKLIRKFVSN